MDNYTVYKITNNINGKIYVGVHKTKNLDDNYMGSGKVLIYAINKHGVENFTKEYLAVFDNSEDMYKMETKIVNEGFVKRDDTYNIKVGGIGGFDEWNYQMSIDKDLRDRWLDSLQNEEYRKTIVIRMKELVKSGRFMPPSFKGCSHTDKTKKNMSESHKGKHDGDKNSQYGKMWIHSLTEKCSTRINKTEPIPDGWLKGRKMKFN